MMCTVACVEKNQHTYIWEDRSKDIHSILITISIDEGGEDTLIAVKGDRISIQEIARPVLSQRTSGSQNEIQ